MGSKRSWVQIPPSRCSKRQRGAQARIDKQIAMINDKSNNQGSKDPIRAERRHYRRINKNFILTYFDLRDPENKYEITQLRNLSVGGVCFISSHKLEPGTKLGIDLKTPYIGHTTYLEGFVLESHEKAKGIIYETRLKFGTLHPDAEFLLKKLIEYFVKGEGRDYE